MMENSAARTELEKALRQGLSAQGLRDPSYAVLVPLVCKPEGVELLIEVRAAGISQAGDPCFPGGRIEPGETPVQAALRETAEELGVRVQPSRILGQLPTVQTLLGRKTDIFVCTLSPEEAEHLTPRAEEVSEVLRVPLAFFLHHAEAESFTVNGHVIWGMTAGAVRHLCSVVRRQCGCVFSGKMI